MINVSKIANNVSTMGDKLIIVPQQGVTVGTVG